MANSRRDATKEQFWRDALQRQQASGLKVRAFCRQENLSEAAFHGWRQTIRQRDGEANPPPGPAFLPLAVADNRDSGIVIELAPPRRAGSGLVLRLPESIPATRLAELVLALEARGAR